MKGSSPFTKELIEEAIKEYLPDLEMIQKELGEIRKILEDMMDEQARDRRRITNIELLLGLDNSLRDPDDVYFEENREKYSKLFSGSIFSNPIQTNPNQNVQNLLYEELKKVPCMRNKDVLKFLGWNKNSSMRATRLMRSMANIYPDVVCDCSPERKRAMRIYRKLG